MKNQINPDRWEAFTLRELEITSKLSKRASPHA